MRRNFLTVFKDLENFLNDDFLNDFNITLRNDLDKNIKKYTSNLPLTNIYEDKWFFKYEIFTPGFLKKDINIEVKDGSIEVTGVLNKEDKDKKGECISKEFNLNKFYRNFGLPENVLLDEIYAKFENGITTIFIPKEKPTKTKGYSRKIKVD